MRTGVVGDVVGNTADTETVIALMRVFMKDAITVAGRYTCAHGRTSVSGLDMQRALKYCARTFFERDDTDLANIVGREQEEMMNEETTDEEEESDENGEEEDCEEEDCEEDEKYTGVPDSSDLQLARNVDTIVQHWDAWNPEDPVHALIKRAINNTPVS